MFKLFRRQQVSQPTIPVSPNILAESSDNERNLADDNEEVWEHLQVGSLSLEESREDNKDIEVNAPVIEIFSQSDLTRNLTVIPSNIHFEVIDAKIASSSKSKYVVYTILLRNTVNDLNPVSIEKRYSAFEQLNSDMKKAFPHIMHRVTFPRKLLSGNFKAKTIAERSRAFEQYLCHLVMREEVRLSSPFAPFFYEDEWKKACDLILKKRFPLAIVVLRKVLEIQRKLLADVNANTTLTLCTLTVCYVNCSNDSQSHLCARVAINSIHTNNSEFLLPLLNFCVRLSWTLGREKLDLEMRLRELKSKRNYIDTTLSLQDMVYQKVSVR